MGPPSTDESIGVGFGGDKLELRNLSVERRPVTRAMHRVESRITVPSHRDRQRRRSVAIEHNDGWLATGYSEII